MKYKSCRLLEHGIYFHLDPEFIQLCVGHCCNTDHLDIHNRLYLYKDIQKQKLDWDYIFNEKKKLRENAKKGILPVQCDGCFELQERDWDDENYINHFTTGHILKCNSRCIYCPIGTNSECHNLEQNIDMKTIVDELIDKNLLRYDGSLRFVGGEPTLMKEFEYLVDLFSKNNVPEIYVPTSAIKLSKSLCNALKKVDGAAIVASVDAGTRETFKKIKGTKFFDIVTKNMKTYLRYARKKDFVISKFILFPNYNDSSTEIYNWLKNSKTIGHIEVQFDAEHDVSSSENTKNQKYINRTIKMLKYAEILAKGLNLKINSNLAFMNRAKRQYEYQLEHFVSEIDLNLEQDLNSHQNYRNLYLNIDNINIEIIEKNIDKLVQENKFSPKRKVFLFSNKEITKSKNFENVSTLLLRLGFDFEFSTNNIKYNKNLDEIIKTSYSEITFNLSKNPFLKNVQKHIITNLYRSNTLGKIKIN